MQFKCLMNDKCLSVSMILCLDNSSTKIERKKKKQALDQDRATQLMCVPHVSPSFSSSFTKRKVELSVGKIKIKK